LTNLKSGIHRPTNVLTLLPIVLLEPGASTNYN
jgi:hypothetical protein